MGAFDGLQTIPATPAPAKPAGSLFDALDIESVPAPAPMKREERVAALVDDDTFDPVQYSMAVPEEQDLAEEVDWLRKKKPMNAGDYQKLVGTAFEGAKGAVVSFGEGLGATAANVTIALDPNEIEANKERAKTEMAAGGQLGELNSVGFIEKLATKPAEKLAAKSARNPRRDMVGNPGMLPPRGPKGEPMKYENGVAVPATPKELTPEELAKVQAEKFRKLTPEEVDEKARGIHKISFKDRIEEARKISALTAGKVNDEGVIGGLAKAVGAPLGEVVKSPEELEQMGAPVDPKNIEGLGTVADFTFMLPMHIPKVAPALNKVAGAGLRAVGTTGKLLHDVPAKVGGRLGRGLKTGAVAAGVGAGAAYNPEETAAVVGSIIALKGAKKLGTLIDDAGKELLNPKAIVGADKKAAAALAKGAGPLNLDVNLADGQRALRRGIQGTVSAPLAMAPLNAMAAQDAEEFAAMTGGMAGFGALAGATNYDVLNGYRPDYVRAVDAQLREDGASIKYGDEPLDAAHENFMRSAPEWVRDGVNAYRGFFQGLKMPGGKEAQIYVLDESSFAQEVAKRAGISPEQAAAQRGFYDNGTVFVNGSRGPEKVAGTVGHETGGHAAQTILENLAPQMSQLMRDTAGSGLMKDGKATPEFQRFIDAYNKAHGSEAIRAEDPAAVEEFLAETARQVLEPEGAAKFAIPQGLREKVADNLGDFFRNMLGSKRAFDREELPAVNEVVRASLYELGRLRNVPESGQAPENPAPAASAPPADAGASTPAPEAGATPTPKPATPADPLAAFGLDQAVVDAARDYHMAQFGDLKATRSNSRKGITGESVDKKAERLGKEWDEMFAEYAAYLEENGLQANPATIHQDVIAHGLMNGSPAVASFAPEAVPAQAPETPAEKPRVRIFRDTDGQWKVRPDDAPAAPVEGLDVTPQPQSNEQPVAVLEIDPSPTGGTPERSESPFATPETPETGRVNPPSPSLEEIRGALKASKVPTDKAAHIEGLVERMGKHVYLDYQGADKPGIETGEGDLDFSGGQRRKEYKDSPAAKRAKGEAPAYLQRNKSFIPTRAAISAKTGKVSVLGFSLDKMLNNARAILDAAKTNKIATGYDQLKALELDSQIEADFKALAENHANGYKGDGSGAFKQFPDTGGVQPNPDFAPIPIPADRFRVLNMAMANDVASKGKSKKAETRAKAQEAVALARENQGFLDIETGEVNPLRSELTKKGFDTGVLESPFEYLKPELIEAVRDQPEGGQRTVRPAGFDVDPASMVSKGFPEGKKTAAGFMPDMPEDARARIKKAAKPFDIESPYMGGNKRDEASMVPGVWMTKSGDIIPITSDHESAAIELFGLEDPRQGDGLQAGYSQGMVRVTIRNWGDNKAVAITGPKPTAAQRRNLKDWAVNHNYGFEDYTGRYQNGVLFMPDTPAFNEWFKDSKVVDENGEPLVVYKGMYPHDYTKETREGSGWKSKLTDPGPLVESIDRQSEFPAFNDGEAGLDNIAGFFGDAKTASHFAEIMNGSVFPMYLSIKNPLVIEADGKKAGEVQFGKSGKAFRDAMRSGEYDGAIIKGTSDEGTIYITTKPEQSKSAIANNGDFNPEDPRFNFMPDADEPKGFDVDVDPSSIKSKKEGKFMPYAGESARGFDDAESEGRVFRGKYDGKQRFEVSDKEARITEQFKELARNAHLAGKDVPIHEVTYLKNKDGTFTISASKKNPKDSKDFLDYEAMTSREIREMFGQDVLDAMHKEEGEFSLIGSDLKDAKSLIIAKNVTVPNGIPLDGILTHPKLFKQYPELRDVPVQIIEGKGGSLGSFSLMDDGSTRITLSDKLTPRQARSTLIHEIQHWIQEREGFAKGSGIQTEKRAMNAEAGRDRWRLSQIMSEWKRVTESEAFKKAEEEFAKADYSDEALEIRNAVPEQKRALELSRELWDLSIKYNFTAREARQATPEELPKLIGEPDDFKAMDRYRRSAGEIEARDVQSRIDLDEKERAEKAPYSSEDIKREDAIMRFMPEGENLDKSHVYHVTTADRLKSITATGLKPGSKKAIGGAAYDENRKGKVFVGAEDGVSFWTSRAEDHIVDQFDDYDKKGIAPVVLRMKPKEGMEKDAMGSEDARSDAFAIKSDVSPDELEVWDGSVWVPLKDAKIDPSVAFDEDGYIRNDSPLSNPKFMPEGGEYETDFSESGYHNGVKYDVHAWGKKALFINGLKASKPGDGMKFLKDLTAWADKNGVTISGDARPMRPNDGVRGLEQDKLVRLYKRFGFESYGRDSMRRSPKGSFMPPDSPEFKSWFGKSKVVDESGEPRLMFHATATEGGFTEFKKEKIRPSDYDIPVNGFWLSSDKGTSPAFTNPKATIPVYLSIQNPAPSDVWRKVAREVYKDEKLREGARSFDDETRMRLQEMGYDGIRYQGKPDIDAKALERDGEVTFKTPAGATYKLKHEKEFNGLDLYQVRDGYAEHITGYSDLEDYLSQQDEIWLAFEPTQIKSATDNTGAYDPTNPDIRYMPDDDAYLKAVKAGDEAGAQEMIDKSAKAAGYEIFAAHSTNSGEFNEFKTSGLSAHFGTEKAALDRAEDLRKFSQEVVGRNHDEARVIPVALKIENPLRLPDLASLAMDERGRIEDLDAAREKWLESLSEEDRAAWENPEEYEGDVRDEIQTEYGDEPRAMAWESETDFAEVLRDKGLISMEEFWEVQYDPDAAVEILKEKGFDGIVYKNGVEDAGNDSYIVFDSSQVKRRDITKDGGGSPVPISERFRSDKSDIRFMPNDEKPRFVQPKRGSYAGDEFVPVNVAKFDEAFKKDGPGFYIGKDGEGAIEGRMERFGKWVQKGEPIEAPEVSVNEKGVASFINGRHRYVYLRDKGLPVMPVSMSPESVENARKAGLLDEKGAFMPEEEKNLVAMHNTSEQGILAADRLGGIPAPSLAILPKDKKFTKFGTISLVGDRNLIDPVLHHRNEVYEADIYSTRQPKPIFKVQNKAVKELIKGFQKLRKDWHKFRNESPYEIENWIRTGIEGNALRAATDAERSLMFKVAFTEEKTGKKLEAKEVPARLYDEFSKSPEIQEIAAMGREYFDKPETEKKQLVGDAVRKLIAERSKRTKGESKFVKDTLMRAYFDEEGVIKFGKFDHLNGDIRKIVMEEKEIDSSDAEKEANDYIAAHNEEFLDWIEEKLEPIFTDPTVKVKSKSQPYTLDNLVEAMSKRSTRGQEELGSKGLGLARAKSAKRFETVEDLKKHVEKIVSSEDFEVKREALQTAHFKAADLLSKAHRYSDNAINFDLYDDSSMALGDYLSGKKGKEGMERALARNNFALSRVTPEAIDAMIEAARLLKEIPTEYFEAKLVRPVKLKEFTGAVVPAKTPERVIEVLKRNGLDVETYESNEDRPEAVRRLAERKGANFMPDAPSSIKSKNFDPDVTPKVPVAANAALALDVDLDEEPRKKRRSIFDDLNP